VDIESVQRVLRSGPIQRRVIFLATPHRGSPSARRRFGRLARLLVGRRTPELQPLRRLTCAPRRSDQNFAAPTADPTLILDSDHEIYKDPRAVAEVVRILAEDLSSN